MSHMSIPGRVAGAVAISAFLAGATVQAQVPRDIHAKLVEIGQIVDPACTAKLYRPLMPANDYNTYWPVGAAAPVNTGRLYPGITIARDTSFGPHPKDLLDIFSPERPDTNRTVLIYVPGGGGNKIEQQAKEANAFYDNIGRWAVKNDMIGVTAQRHPGQEWDDGGRDIAVAVDWVKANISKYGGNPNRIFIWAHSAGNGPLGQYVGHADRWPNGVNVMGAIFMSGQPAQVGGGGGGRGNAPAGGGRGAAPAGPQSGATCGATGGNAGTDGAIAGPSSALAGRAAGAGPAGGQGGGQARGGGGGGRGQQLTPEQQAERDNLPGLKKSNVRIMLAYAELDPGIMGAMPPASIALHDELCSLDGPRARDGEGHCPAMLFAKDESHMSEVFSIDTADKNVSGPILNWIKKVK
jgi:hypothetical protein